MSLILSTGLPLTDSANLSFESLQLYCKAII